MASRIWFPLDPGRRQIRLAHLAPSKDLNEKPTCSLSVVSLDENPQYEALSYTWGDPKVTTPIRLRSVYRQSGALTKLTTYCEISVDAGASLNQGDPEIPMKDSSPSVTDTLAQNASKLSLSDEDDTYESQWPVTTNLELALRYLRHESMERILWIDAICIDQSNIEERNHQVPFMKTIYSNALAVRIWLGSPTPGSNDAIAIIKEMNQGVPLQDIKLQDHLIDDNDLRLVIELNRRPWWNRTWVQQELLLAKKALIHCGLGFFEWDKFLSIEDFNAAIGSAMKSLRFTYDVLDDFIDSFDASTRIRHMEDVYKDPESSDEDYVTVIAEGRVCHNSDERDAIYGFLGLLSDSLAEKIKPDYNAPAVDVFRDAAIQFTLCSQSLIIFSLIQYAENKDRCMSTWVPSWHALSSPEATEEWYVRSNRLVQLDHFSSCGKHTIKFELHEGNTVKVSGAKFDSVARIGEVMLLFESSLGEILLQTQGWRLLCFTDEVQEQSQYIAGNKVGEAFWRTLINDFYNGRHELRRRCQPGDYQSYLEWLDELENTTETFWESENANSFQVSFNEACFNRRFFITRRGYFGIGPAELEEGDEIYILAGGKHPFALRQSPKPQSDTFELIGDCYVHGIMDGEAVTENEPILKSEDDSTGKFHDTKRSDPDLPLRKFHDIFMV